MRRSVFTVPIFMAVILAVFARIPSATATGRQYLTRSGSSDFSESMWRNATRCEGYSECFSQESCRNALMAAFSGNANECENDADGCARLLSQHCEPAGHPNPPTLAVPVCDATFLEFAQGQGLLALGEDAGVFSGGLGELKEPPYSAWACLAHPSCATVQCYRRRVMMQYPVWDLWGPNSQLRLVPEETLQQMSQDCYRSAMRRVSFPTGSEHPCKMFYEINGMNVVNRTLSALGALRPGDHCLNVSDDEIDAVCDDSSARICLSNLASTVMFAHDACPRAVSELQLPFYPGSFSELCTRDDDNGKYCALTVMEVASNSMSPVYMALQRMRLFCYSGAVTPSHCTPSCSQALTEVVQAVGCCAQSVVNAFYGHDSNLLSECVVDADFDCGDQIGARALPVAEWPPRYTGSSCSGFSADVVARCHMACRRCQVCFDQDEFSTGCLLTCPDFNTECLGCAGAMDCSSSWTSLTDLQQRAYSSTSHLTLLLTGEDRLEADECRLLDNGIIYACEDNYYGSDCSRYCSDTTCGEGECNPIGDCTCPVNRRGAHCESCAAEYYGPDCSCTSNITCNGHGFCDDNSGTCVCLPSFAGSACDVCDDGKFGIDCVGCDEDYYWDGDACQLCAGLESCGDGYFRSECGGVESGACVPCVTVTGLPDNAVFTNDGDQQCSWSCQEGHWLTAAGNCSGTCAPCDSYAEECVAGGSMGRGHPGVCADGSTATSSTRPASDRGTTAAPLATTSPASDRGTTAAPLATTSPASDRETTAAPLATASPAADPETTATAVPVESPLPTSPPFNSSFPIESPLPTLPPVNSSFNTSMVNSGVVDGFAETDADELLNELLSSEDVRPRVEQKSKSMLRSFLDSFMLDEE